MCICQVATNYGPFSNNYNNIPSISVSYFAMSYTVSIHLINGFVHNIHTKVVRLVNYPLLKVLLLIYVHCILGQAGS